MFRPIHRLKSRLHLSSAELQMLMFALLLFMIGALSYVWPNIKMVKLAYDFYAIEKEHRELLRENDLLKLEKQSLQSLYRIQSLSKTRLGLNEPDKDQMVTIFLK